MNTVTCELPRYVSVSLCSLAISNEKLNTVPVLHPFASRISLSNSTLYEKQSAVVWGSLVLEHRKWTESPINSNNNCSRYKHLSAHITPDIFFQLKSARGTFSFIFNHGVLHLNSQPIRQKIQIRGYQLDWCRGNERAFFFTCQSVPTLNTIFQFWF